MTELWRPAGDAEAAGNLAAFIEWRRARGLRQGVTPGELFGAAAHDPAALNHDIAGFAGLPAGVTAHAALLRWTGTRTALVVSGAVDRAWTRDELRAAAPPLIAALLRRIRPSDLPALAADHLFGLELRPDDRLLWHGDPDDPWPLGAWIVGATVILAPPGTADATTLGRRTGATHRRASRTAFRPPA